jgi:hypothetical protein
VNEAPKAVISNSKLLKRIKGTSKEQLLLSFGFDGGSKGSQTAPAPGRKLLSWFEEKDDESIENEPGMWAEMLIGRGSRR